MSLEEIRLACLRLAAELDIPPEKVVEFAEKFFAWISRSGGSP